MKRKASCQCGQLSATTAGEPERVAICHCAECQRRTGSAFNLGAVFDEPNVELEGEYNVYTRTGELGSEIEFHFCPKCGSTVHWLFGGIHVVAVGCYADSEFPQPTVSLYGKRRHHWLPVLEGIPSFVGNRESEQE
jgi:hypothetical protein